jgi:hypothetical protein
LPSAVKRKGSLQLDFGHSSRKVYSKITNHVVFGRNLGSFLIGANAMGEIIKEVFTAPLATLFVIAGILFLFIAVVGNISGKIEPGERARIVSAVVGIAFIALGLAMHLLQKAPGVSESPVISSPQTKSDPPETSLQKPTSNPMAQGPVTLASGAEVNVGPLVYKILAAQLDRSGPDKFSLSFRIRLTTKNYSAPLYHDSFRLLVDGVPQAPEREPQLRTIVESNSAKEGMIRFVIPDAVRDVKLQIIGDGIYRHERPLIPINLKADKP